MSNGKVLDKSGLNNNGNLFNISTSTFYVPGKLGQAFKFDGVDDYVSTPHSATLAPTNGTISLWMYVKGWNIGAGYTAIVSKRQTTTDYFLFYLSTLRFDWGSSVGRWDTGYNPPLNKWLHIVITEDSVAGRVLYVNGARQNSTSAGSAYTTNGNPLSIGADFTSPGGSVNADFNGYMDNVRVYNRALSAAEVKQLYNMGSPKIASSVSTQTIATSTCSTGLSCGLVGYWTFDGKDMLNGKVLDKSGLNNNGNLFNISTSTFYVPGKIGQGLMFNGVNNSIDTSSNFIGTGALTISVWIYANGYGGGGIGRMISNAQTYARTNSSGVLDFTSDNGVHIVSSAAGTLSLRKWIHFVVVRDSTGIANIYLNGSLSGTANQNSGTPGVGTTNVFIGNSASGSTRSINGILDDVRVYNRALTAAEVRQLYNMGSPKIASSVSTQTIATSTCATGLSCGLVGYWTFDGKDMSNGKVLDKSGLNNNGNLFNISTSTFYVPGKIGQAFKFDGADDYVSINKVSGIPVYSDTKPYSVAGWFKSTASVNVERGLYTENFSGGGGFSLEDYGDKFRVWITGQLQAGNYYIPSTILHDGRWHQFVWTDNAGTAQLYVDGVAKASNGTGGTWNYTTAPKTVNGAVYIGYAFGYGNFSGSMDNVRVYNRALTAAEVRQLYNMGK